MAAELDIVRLKVTRAEKHFEDFKAEVGVGPNARKLRDAAYTEIDYHAGTLTYISLAPIPSPEARVILGDSIHQLRSALDHMVCALAMRTNPRSVCEDSKLQFPIFKAPKDFASDWRVSKGVYEKLLGKAECAEIEQCQPYILNPATPEDHPLYILTKLDNLDKHRLVLVVEQAVRLKGSIVTVGKYEAMPNKASFDSGKQPLQNGRYTMQVQKPNEPHGIEHESPEPYIVFTETDGICDNRSAFPLFREMAKAVKDTIARFDKFF